MAKRAKTQKELILELARELDALKTRVTQLEAKAILATQGSRTAMTRAVGVWK